MRKIWEKIKKIKARKIATNYWQVYGKIVDKVKHVKTKAETFTIEGLNNLLRHYVARFHRKTHCYSKSEEMINLTLALFAVRKELLSILN